MASRLSLFLAELKRRKVGRVAAAYAAVGTAIAVSVPDVFATMLIPAWVARLVIIVILLGFPVALVLAWAMEITSEGIKKTEDLAPEGLAARAPERWSPGWMGFAAAAVFVAMGVGYWMFVRGGGEGASIDSRAELVPDLVLVTLFENQTGDPVLDPAGRMATDFIMRDLVTTGVVKVLPIDLALILDRERAEGGGSSPQEAALEGKARYLVSGTFFARGDSLVVQGQIMDVAEGQVRTAVGPIHASRTDPSRGFTELAQRTAGALAALIDHAWAPNWADYIPAVSYPSYAEFTAGQDAFIHSDWEEAIQRFTRAIELDSTWLQPHLMRVVALRNGGQRERADSLRQVAERLRDQANPMERASLDLQKAWYQGDREAAYRAVGRAAELTPGGQAAFQWGYEAIRTNRLRKAVEILEGLDPTRPDLATWVSYWARLTSAYHLLGEHQRELETARLGRIQIPDPPLMLLYECWALIGLGQAEEALRVLEEYRDRGGNLTGMRNTALEFRAHGQEASGRQLLNEALARIDAEAGEADALRSTTGETLYYLERWEEARGIFTELLVEDPTSVSYLGFLGRIAARLGEREEAMRISEELAALDSPYLFGQNTLRLARIAAILGDSDRAVSLLQQAHREGLSFSLTLHRDVDLESLRGHPAFEEFMRPKG